MKSEFIWAGRLLAIHITEQAAADMQELEEAKLIAGVGIEGDRYATGRGTYSKKPQPERQVTLIKIETPEAVQRDHRSNSRRRTRAATCSRAACR